jgi:hypothetical protein
VLLLVSSWPVWCCFTRLCVGFFFLAGCVLGVFLFQGLAAVATGQTSSVHREGPKRRTREGGGSQWELIKILLEGDRDSNKTNTTSNTRLRLNYPSWSRPRSHWSATDPRNQQTIYRAKTHQHAQRKLARLAACATPVRPMACAGHTGDTGQTGG